MIIGRHENFRDEYCATILRIGEIHPIEGADKIVKIFANGNSVVVGKNEFKEGDVAVYVSVECTIHELFLHLNSMFEDKELNANPEQKGYINKHGRVRCVKLRNVPSMGILLTPQSIATFLNEPVEDVVKFLEEHIGEDFDMINDERFVKVYVPPIKENTHVSKGDKRDARLKKFKMLLEGSFRRHYDTHQLAKEIGQFSPDDEVFISNKLHGTSAIFSYILTNVPTNWFKRMWRKYVTKTNVYDQKYNLVYASRNTIKNEYINPNQRIGGYYDDDVWGHWAEKLEGLIPKDYHIYGEIVGYNPHGKPIQGKGENIFDYGCEPGQSKLMVYRITIGKDEVEIPDVIKFGEYLKEHLGDEIVEFPLLYHGTLQNLYPDLDVQNHWHENVLERLKVDERFNMEQFEKMCVHKVPVEGFVLRKANDPVSEAWKLKTTEFRLWERGRVDAGEVDMEMEEGYVE